MWRKHPKGALEVAVQAVMEGTLGVEHREREDSVVTSLSLICLPMDVEMAAHDLGAPGLYVFKLRLTFWGVDDS